MAGTMKSQLSINKTQLSEDRSPQLNDTHVKAFWVSWQNGLIQAGRGSVIDTDVFLSF